MDEQYSNSHKKHHDIFKFAENNDKLEIDYRNELPGGWQLALQSSPEVSLHYCHTYIDLCISEHYVMFLQFF